MVGIAFVSHTGVVGRYLNTSRRDAVLFFEHQSYRRFVFQRGNRRIRSRGRRLHSSVRKRGNKRQSHGNVDHDKRLQNSLRVEGHRRHTLFSVCEAGQERQGTGRKIVPKILFLSVGIVTCSTSDVRREG